MILAFSTKEASITSDLDDRFGRASHFVVMNSQSGKTLHVLENRGKDAAGSAGIKAIQLLADYSVEGIIAPKLGPKAIDAARALNLSVWEQGDSINPAQALVRFKKGELKKV